MQKVYLYWCDAFLLCMIATHEDIAINLLGVNEIQRWSSKLIYLVASCCTTKGTERERESTALILPNITSCKLSKYE